MGFAMIWPIALIVLSNVFYHICSKETPSAINPFASLTVTYLIGAVVSLVLYFTINKSGNLIQEYKNINWSGFVLGLAIVGLKQAQSICTKQDECQQRVYRSQYNPFNLPDFYRCSCLS